MKSIHSYFKLKGGKLKTKYHSYTRVRSRFLFACFFQVGGLRGRGNWRGSGRDRGLPPAHKLFVLNLHFENFNPHQFCSR